MSQDGAWKERPYISGKAQTEDMLPVSAPNNVNVDEMVGYGGKGDKTEEVLGGAVS